MITLWLLIKTPTEGHTKWVANPLQPIGCNTFHLKPFHGVGWIFLSFTRTNTKIQRVETMPFNNPVRSLCLRESCVEGTELKQQQMGQIKALKEMVNRRRWARRKASGPMKVSVFQPNPWRRNSAGPLWQPYSRRRKKKPQSRRQSWQIWKQNARQDEEVALGLDAALGGSGCMGHSIQTVIRLLTMPLLSLRLL